MSEQNIHSEVDNTNDQHRNVYTELKAGQQKAKQEIELEKQKAESEALVIQKLHEEYPSEELHPFKIGNIEVITCGKEATAEQVQIIANGLNRIREKLGDRADKVFADLKVYIASDVVSGGGQALGRENTIIMDSKKMTLGISEVEELLSPTGDYRIGDRSNLVDGNIPDGELSFIHELGHILEFRAQGDFDKSFAELNQTEAPTLYGQQNAREDYAESFMYLIYDGKINQSRTRIIESDINSLAETNN
jgi:hypothetical protein